LVARDPWGGAANEIITVKRNNLPTDDSYASALQKCKATLDP